MAKKLYGFSQEQVTVVKEYVDEILGKRFICPSKLLYASPVLIVKKPKRGL